MSTLPTKLKPGKIILLGSGETAPSARTIYEWLFRQLEPPVHVAMLETPAGFEPNSAAVVGQVGTYIEKRLQNYHPQITMVPARKRGTRYSPDDPELATPIGKAHVIFMGPGSPTYAVRQLQESYAWNLLRASHHLGASLIFSSAATLACSAQTLPVYEIYKVGEELHWKPGLDFFDDYGLSLILIPHWNNNDGGHTLDTSRCYMGVERYNALYELLPASVRRSATLVGLDENTALAIDPTTTTCQVLGHGVVTLMRNGQTVTFDKDAVFDLHELGNFHLPTPNHCLPTTLYEQVQQGKPTPQAAANMAAAPPPEVLTLVQQRTDARNHKDWATADRLREAIEAAGWQLVDTPDGPLLTPG